MKTDKPNIPCVILAGGQSKRFGSPKGLAMIGEETMLARIARILRTQTTGPVWLNAEPDGPYADQRLDIISDIFKDCGPLGGIHAAIVAAKTTGYEQVITVPVDIPFLPDDLIEKLVKSGVPSIAESDSRVHPVIGIWSSKLVGELASFLQTEERKAQMWAEKCHSKLVRFEIVNGVNPFWNVNSLSDCETIQESIC